MDRATTRAIRALTAWQFRRIFKLIVGFIAALIMILWAFILFASWYWSAWWLVFLIVLLPTTLIVAGLSAFIWKLSARVLPRHLDKEETALIEKFNDKLFGLVEQARTPLPIMATFLAYDIIRRRPNRRINAAIDDSVSLKRDFAAIKRLF